MSEQPDKKWSEETAVFIVDELVSRKLMAEENSSEAIRIVEWELSAQLGIRESERSQK